MLEEKLSMAYCADSGAEKSIISARNLNRLRELGGLVETKKLKQPLQCETVGKFKITSNYSVHLHIKLHTAAGPVQPVRPYEVLVIEEDEEEFILGEDILNDLGISVDRQLEQLAERSAADDDDPICFDDELGVKRTPDADVKRAVENMISSALENGFPAKKEAKLRSIVYMFDIWRLQLGPDPPAKVPPLEIRLKKGAVPFRSKPRAYPPHIRQFLHDFNEELEIGRAHV